MKYISIILLSFLIKASALLSQSWTEQSIPANTDLNGIWATDANNVWACGNFGIILRTTNAGTTWTLANNGLAGNHFYAITAVNANIAIAGAADGSVWRTTNGGQSWTSQTLTPQTIFIDIIHMFDASNGFAVGDPPSSSPGIWRYYITTNGGVNWSLGANAPPNAAGETTWNNSYMALDTGHIWWGTNSSRIWKGSFRGPFTWGTTTQVNTFEVAFNDANTGAAGMTDASHIVQPNNMTVNGGSTWTASSFTPSGPAFAMKSVPYSGYMWLGTTDIYRSTNSGVTWTSQLTLTPTTPCYGLTFVNVNLGWACTGNGHIYKYTDNVQGIIHNRTIPSSFKLEQNYPNPFNPATIIRFQVPLNKGGSRGLSVKLEIYDAPGKEITILVNEQLNPGNYSVTWNAANYPSGVYFYKLSATGGAVDFTDSKKMVLIK